MEKLLLSFNFLTISYSICLLIIILLGYLILKNRFRSNGSLAYFLFLISCVIWIIGLYGIYYFGIPYREASFYFTRITYAFAILIPFFLTVFFYYFPQITLKSPRYISILLILTTIAVMVISGFTPLVHNELTIVDNNVVGSSLGPLYWFYVSYYIGYLIIASLIALNKIINFHGIERKKLIYASIGCWIFVSLAVTTNIILPIYNIFYFVTAAPIFTMIFIIPSFFSIVKYRFLNITHFFILILRNILIFSLFILSIEIIENLIHLFSIISNPRLILIISSGIGLILYIILHKNIPTIGDKNITNFKNNIFGLKIKLYSCNNYETLRSLIEETFIVKLSFHSAKVFIIRSNEKKLNIPIYLRNKFSSLLASFKNDVLIKYEIGFLNYTKDEKVILKEGLDEINAEFCLPLFSGNNIIGFLALGGKGDGLELSKEEIDELIEIKVRLEISFMNILIRNKLESENDLMKRIIQDKTHELSSQNKEINSLLKQQQDFMALTAHELRTPLNSAIMQLNAAIDFYKNDPKLLVNDINSVGSSLDNLRQLTEKLFNAQQYDLNKIELKKEKIDIISCIKKYHKSLLPSYKNKGIKLLLEINKGKNEEFLIEADTVQLRQTLDNITNNASRYTPNDEGVIKIKLSCNTKGIEIRISDNGSGIKDGDKQNIFKKFKTSNKTGGQGIGLGLYVCKKIISLHKGSLSIEDTPGGGATFVIKLPKIIS